ncbi:hypothetical protein K2P47_03095 [Patescibacteria group bacterium]|nr:hypothetical protein [Patescibacteria group bacterium]
MKLIFGTSLFQLSALVVILYFAFGTLVASASFGITPPYVRNTSLTRNSTYEQQILLVRGDPNMPLNAQIVVDAPEIQDWIEIVEGTTILLPRGEQKVPMTVRIKVPSDADYREYEGKIRIRTQPTNDQVADGVVSISLGAQVDINLNVIDRVIEDFRVRKIDVSDLDAGHKLGWLFFPGKINFTMSLENTGNVNIAPSKVQFRIFDRTGAVLLEETQHTGKLKKIAPYATEDVTAHLPTRLPAGSYMARYAIYNNDEVKQEGELNLSILPYGTLQTAGYGFGGLSIPHKISILLPLFAFIIIVLYAIYYRRKGRKDDTLIN